MRELKNLLSVIITTYNRYELLIKAIKKVKQQTYKNIEIIVSDDCSTDLTFKIQENYPEIKYIKTQQNIGYSKNSKFALTHAKGDYVIFLCDDDSLKDDTFFEQAVNEYIKNKNMDTLISRTEIQNGNDIVINNYPFKNMYSPKELFNWLLEVRSNFSDYFSLSSTVFKKEILIKTKAFDSVFEDSSTIDASVLFKSIACSRSIGFLDVIGCTWVFPATNTLSNANRDDLVKQAKYNLAFVFDMDEFLVQSKIEEDLQSIIKKALNQRVEWVFDAILSEKERLKNQINFQRCFQNININEDIYIYGRGWTGLELKSFLINQKAKFKCFIDDYKVSFDDTISFDEFKKLNGESSVVISTYKYKDIYKIYKKLSTCKQIIIHDLLD